ncbi:MAG: CDP-alcohol phosphatidyltransferase family protein [Patescibacteria group bacterium]
MKAKKNTAGKVYDTDFLYKISESLSYRLFGPLFAKLPFSHIQITVANFFTSGLASVYFFTLGTHWGYLLGIFLCFTYSILDWMDGFVAKSRGIQSALGGWLDPALDYVWQHLLVAGLVLGVYQSKDQNYPWLVIGMASLVSLVVANYIGDIFRDKFDFKFRSSLADFRDEITTNKKIGWVDLLGLEILAPTNFISIFLFTIRYQLILGALLNRMDIVMLIILGTQMIRSVVLFYTYALYLDHREGASARVIVRALERRKV